jgi:Icc-related predicted phosphoesterase
MTFKLFLASDVHGSSKCYRKFLNSAKFYGADVIVLCGDITGKALIFIIKRPDGSYWANYLGSEYQVKSEHEMLTLKNQIDDAGYYTYIMEQQDYETIRQDSETQHNMLMNCISERVKEWISLTNTRMANSGVEVYVLPGNDDPYGIDPAFQDSKIAVNPEGQVLKIMEGHEMIATGYANMTPWKAPRDIEDTVLYEKLTSLAGQLENPEEAIFTLHPPPYGTSLDYAPLLDETLKPKTVVGQVEVTHVGSHAVRKLIEEYQPMLGLHGHVHESKAVQKIGRTLCFNAGSEYGTGILKGTLMTVSKRKVENYAFTTG